MWGGPGRASGPGKDPDSGGPICIPEDRSCGYTAMAEMVRRLPDDGRMRYANFGKGIAFWQSEAEARQFVNAFDGVVSADTYWLTDNNICSFNEGGVFFGGSRRAGAPVPPTIELRPDCRQGPRPGATGSEPAGLGIRRGGSPIHRGPLAIGRTGRGVGGGVEQHHPRCPRNHLLQPQLRWPLPDPARAAGAVLPGYAGRGAADQQPASMRWPRCSTPRSPTGWPRRPGRGPDHEVVRAATSTSWPTRPTPPPGRSRSRSPASATQKSPCSSRTGQSRPRAVCSSTPSPTGTRSTCTGWTAVRAAAPTDRRRPQPRWRAVRRTRSGVRDLAEIMTAMSSGWTR